MKTVRIASKARGFLWMVLCGIFIFLSGCAYDADCRRSAGFWRMPLDAGSSRKCGDCARSGGYYQTIDGVCYGDNLADEVRACAYGYNAGYYLDGVCFNDRHEYFKKDCERRYPDLGGYYNGYCYESKREYDDLLEACIASGGNSIEGRTCVVYEEYEEYDDYDYDYESSSSKSKSRKSRASSPKRVQPVRRR
ncbi:MAG: hypothetical protein LBQ75_00220 [Zoogloeaceae bacterium]|jgi:hypothetical protein|nr:hypothetical protein [Zoogloeaceae bacterium]